MATSTCYKPSVALESGGCYLNIRVNLTKLKQSKKTKFTRSKNVVRKCVVFFCDQHGPVVASEENDQ